MNIHQKEELRRRLDEVLDVQSGVLLVKTPTRVATIKADAPVGLISREALIGLKAALLEALGADTATSRADAALAAIIRATAQRLDALPPFTLEQAVGEILAKMPERAEQGRQRHVVPDDFALHRWDRSNLAESALAEAVMAQLLRTDLQVAVRDLAPGYTDREIMITYASLAEVAAKLVEPIAEGSA